MSKLSEPMFSCPCIMHRARNEFGKACRKEYESHALWFSRSIIQDWMPRFDGMSNTITTFDKDNYVLVTVKKGR